MSIIPSLTSAAQRLSVELAPAEIRVQATMRSEKYVPINPLHLRAYAVFKRRQISKVAFTLE
jgi:hypothetical protein